MLVLEEKGGDPEGTENSGVGVSRPLRAERGGDCGQKVTSGARGSGESRAPGGQWGGVPTAVHRLQLLGPLGLWGRGGQAQPFLTPPPPPLSPLPVSPCRKRAAACASGRVYSPQWRVAR